MNAKLRDVWDSVSQGAPTARDFEPVESVSPRNHEIPKFRIAPAEGPDSRISTDWNRGVSVIFVQHVRSMYKVKTRRRDQVRSMAAPSIQCTTLLNGPAFHYCLTVGSGEKGEVQIKAESLLLSLSKQVGIKLHRLTMPLKSIAGSFGGLLEAS